MPLPRHPPQHKQPATCGTSTVQTLPNLLTPHSIPLQQICPFQSPCFSPRAAHPLPQKTRVDMAKTVSPPACILWGIDWSRAQQRLLRHPLLKAHTWPV